LDHSAFAEELSSGTLREPFLLLQSADQHSHAGSVEYAGHAFVHVLLGQVARPMSQPAASVDAETTRGLKNPKTAHPINA
jgi:hypothetical protein